jgi:hypothetical protein
MKKLNKFFVVILALCAIPRILSADFYTREAKLHLRKDGTACIEVESHLYEVLEFYHSRHCECEKDHATVINTRVSVP